MNSPDSLPLSACCMQCLIDRQYNLIRSMKSEAEKAAHMRAVLQIIQDSRPGETAPVLSARMTRAYETRFGQALDYEPQKQFYNDFMLQRQVHIRQRIQSSPDPLAAAMRFARAGNYIDFGALKEVTPSQLESLLEADSPLDSETYAAFRKDLFSAKTLVYLTDNCGEIVLDKLLLEQLTNRFPALDICVIVRGEKAANDATLSDAAAVGLTGLCRVIGSGSAIAGTYLPDLSPEAWAAVYQADLLISKGQGNFETLHGCGKNIYYLFLCKCAWFERMFGLPQFEGVFYNERRIHALLEL